MEFHSAEKDAAESKTTTVVVLGSGRCGTSLTTGLLRELSVNMVARHNPSPLNPKGDFECMEAHGINCKIYNLAAGMDLGREPHWTPPLKEDILRQKELVQKDIKSFVSGRTGLWGWKNPKTSLTIELFLPHLVNPRVVVVRRNLADTARSINRAFQLPASRAINSVLYYRAAVEDTLRKYPNLPVLKTRFEKILSDPIREAQRLAEFVGAPSPDEQRIRNFVIPR